MITRSDKLNSHDFHSFIDNQLDTHEIEEIEKRLDSETHALEELQQCLIINEHIQHTFNDVLEEPLPEIFVALCQDSQASLPRNVIKKEAVLIDSNATNDFEDDNVLDAIDNINLADYKVTPSESVIDNHHVKNTSEEIPTNEPVITPDSHRSDPIALNNKDNIDVDDFIQGISEVHSVGEDEAKPFTAQSLGGDLFASDKPSLSTRFDNILKFFTKINWASPVDKIKSLIGRKEKETFSPVDFEQFDVDIEEAIKDTPKWHFLKDRAKEVKAETMETVRERIEPIRSKLPAWLPPLKEQIAAQLYKLNQIHYVQLVTERKYWLLGGIIFGWLMHSIITTPSNAINLDKIEQIAIDSHLYHVNHGLHSIDGGNKTFETNMRWLQEHWGKRLYTLNLEQTPFKRVGATLASTPVGYASVQMFQNDKKHRMSLFVVPWNVDNDDFAQMRCHIPATIDGTCYWVSDSLLYIVASNLTLSRVRQFSETLASKS